MPLQLDAPGREADSGWTTGGAGSNASAPEVKPAHAGAHIHVGDAQCTAAELRALKNSNSGQLKFSQTVACISMKAVLLPSVMVSVRLPPSNFQAGLID